VVERDITYQLFSGAAPLTGGTIQEQIQLIKGSQPSTGGAANPFFDAIAVGPNLQPFTVSQTFIARFNGVLYTNLPLLDEQGNQISHNTNTLEVYPGGVFVNDNNVPANGDCN
jgi:hypothetical protein